MEIKVTNFELIDHYAVPGSEAKLKFIYPALQEFKKIKAPVSIASTTVKSINAVEDAINDYDKTRIVLCEQLCEKDVNGSPIKDGNKYKFTEASISEFNRKLNDLLNMIVTLDIHPIRYSDIADIKEINISCYETLLKYGFIKEEDKSLLNGKADKKELIEN